MPTSVDALTDVACRAWGPVTVRVAWTLLAHRVAVKPGVLRDVRDHIWFNLPTGTPTHLAVDLAEELARTFILRARGGTPPPTRWPEDLDRELSARWRARLHHGPSPRAAWVLRMHYADGIGLDRISQRLGNDLLGVEAAREGIREVVRRTASEDGQSLDSWPDARVDRLIHRLAAMAAEGTPPLVEVVDGLHPEWLDRCVQCSRAYALVRRGVLQRGDLVPPQQGARPQDVVSVLALHLHPAGRHHRKTLAREVSGTAFPIGDDILLLDGRDLPAAAKVLRLAAEVGMPRRDHLRGVLLKGPGRWSRHGLAGPLVDQVQAALRSAPWGCPEGVGELPEPLPAPPSAARAWLAVAAMAMAATWAMSAAFNNPGPVATHPLLAQATPGRGGVWVEFDVDEEAYVVVVRERNGALDLLLDSAATSDKIELASGDGSYRLHTRGEGVLIASAGERVGDVESLITSANRSTDPLGGLAEQIAQILPTSDVWLYRR